MTGAEVLVRALEDLGVRHVFGYTGAAILPVMDELGKSAIKIIVNSNEQSAAFSAAGYSRSGNGVGMAIVTSGPAITNTLTAVADSFTDSVPLVVIAGQVPEHKIGTDSFQHIDVRNVFGATAKKVILLDSISNIESVIKESYFLSKSGKPGPVVIDVPINLQQKVNAYDGCDISHYEKVFSHETHLSETQCESFFELLGKSRKPLLYLGGGLNSVGGSLAIRRFNALFGMPSVNTLMAKGVLDERDPLSLGLLGMFGTPYANRVIQDNDLFFAIGVRWDDRVAEKVGFAIEAKIAYIDINLNKIHSIRRERRPEFSFMGDATVALGDLSDYAQKNGIRIDIGEWQEFAADLKKRWPLDYRRDGDMIQQAETLDLLNRFIDDRTIITTGVGNHQLLAAQYLQMGSPKSFLSSGGFGTMGFGMPVAVGSHFANPKATVVVVDGDGSFRMNMGELHTIGSLGLPIKVLLLNNRCDGMVRNLENTACNGRHSATERDSDVNFAEMAKVCGFSFFKRVNERECLQSSLESFWNSGGPCLLEVMTDPEEVLYPIVRPGSSYADMDLGPYIKEKASAPN
ncbi:thiamine pyrophosphate-binding protein [Candidatus Uhrbacteria bacterium]|nr:thiamine pyrophosphate-binding protein [Candidatus Uhrbacteria bacterium]